MGPSVHYPQWIKFIWRVGVQLNPEAKVLFGRVYCLGLGGKRRRWTVVSQFNEELQRAEECQRERGLRERERERRLEGLPRCYPLYKCHFPHFLEGTPRQQVECPDLITGIPPHLHKSGIPPISNNINGGPIDSKWLPLPGNDWWWTSGYFPINRIHFLSATLETI